MPRSRVGAVGGGGAWPSTAHRRVRTGRRRYESQLSGLRVQA